MSTAGPAPSFFETVNLYFERAAALTDYPRGLLDQNAGGVTVSYFEWVKNLSHVRFGRVGKRFEEAAFERMLLAVEKATGRLFPQDEHRRIARGADEIDLVNSGLEETMIGAYRQLRELMRQDARVKDLRTAAFLNALRKVATSYQELGIFP